MTDNREPETEPREDIKADLQSEKNGVLEKLKTVAAETEEIKNSQKQKFDEFAEKLQSIEDAVSKMSILSNNPFNTAQESVKKFILKHEFKNLNKLKEMEDPSSELFEYFNADWCLRASCTGGSVYITIWGDTKQSDMSIETELKTFDESQKDVSDVVLVVHDTRFYVSKMYLASQSTYFKTLFLGGFSESKKSEITLSGIDADEFQHFLEVLYGEFAIDDFTVEGILLIADLYDTPMVTKKCEMFLLKESKKEFNKKLQLSSKFRLGELKTQCLAKINTLDNVRELLPGDLSDLDPSVALTILQKCVDSK
ncbi:hypothetical protein L5515_002102 [Caenorhabditis briggsae]|uniref:BTB domain-containing protein n=1 Tax=Caenorhabditis briggsae TaxID=6238 RepID=A0AAE9E751_CAEBR|nr:hypothetical protein L5515_002102 [Caenorhabditis briggsae]